MERLEVYSVIYSWFFARPSMEKDDFLSDRQLWDGLQRELFTNGFNLQHDEVKQFVRNCDKAGYLGGRAKGFTFSEQCKFLLQKKINKEEVGDSGGVGGIQERIGGWAAAMSEKLAEYERTTWWVERSRSYRRSVKWRCELCHKNHARSPADLVSHHISYKSPDGMLVFYKETDDILLAVCKSPCHQLADIARYLRVGRLAKEEIDLATQTLLAGIR